MPDQKTRSTAPSEAALLLLETLSGAAHWTASALCAQADPEVWFPERGQSPHPAKAICSQCPVRSECLTEALANGERFGVWGGLTEHERRDFLRTSDPRSTTSRKPTSLSAKTQLEQRWRFRFRLTGRIAGAVVGANLQLKAGIDDPGAA